MKVAAIAAVTVAVAQAASPCWFVSVERDATYCIPGPICSGHGKEPVGWNCPKKGDIATDACRKHLTSYVDANECVLPVDSHCQKIHTGAWGCVMETASKPVPVITRPLPTPALSSPCPSYPTKDTPKPAAVTPCPSYPIKDTPKPAAVTPCPSYPTKDTPKPAAATPCPSYPTKDTPKPTPKRNSTGSTTGNQTAAANQTQSATVNFPTSAAPKSVHLAAEHTSNMSSGAVVGIVAVAAVGCAVIGVALYNKKTKAPQTPSYMFGPVLTPQ